MAEELIFSVREGDEVSLAEWRLSGAEAIVNTAFFTDRTQSDESTADIRARLGELAEGEEWLAFVFRHQEPDEVTQTRFVRAGFKVEYAVSTGKEILLVACKGSAA